MLRLPATTRTHLRSFWILVSAAIGLTGVLLFRVGGVPYAALWGVSLGLASLAVGWGWPRIAGWPYRTWDRLARRAGRGARLWLTAICFLLLAAVGCAGSRLRWKATGTTGWAPKGALDAGSYESTSSVAGGTGSEAGWARSFVRWTWVSGHAWAWTLLPFLFLLRAVEGSPKGSLGGSVYTLY